MAAAPPAKFKEGRQSVAVKGAVVDLRERSRLGEDARVCLMPWGKEGREIRAEAPLLANAKTPEEWEVVHDAHCVPSRMRLLQSTVETVIWSGRCSARGGLDKSGGVAEVYVREIQHGWLKMADDVRAPTADGDAVPRKARFCEEQGVAPVRRLAEPTVPSKCHCSVLQQ